MTFKQFVILMMVATASLWVGWLWVVFSVNPFSADFVGFTLFYGVLFLALIGSFTLAGVYLRKMKLEHSLLFHLVMLSFRQSIVLSTFFIILLLLQSLRLVFWWNIGFLLLAIFAIEWGILKRERKLFPPNAVGFKETPIGRSPSFTKKDIRELTEEPVFKITEIEEIEIDII